MNTFAMEVNTMNPDQTALNEAGDYFLQSTSSNQHRLRSLHINVQSCHSFVCWHTQFSKTCVKPPLSKRPKIGFQDQLLLNTGQKYCRMLQGEHSAIHLTFIKLPFVTKIFVLSIFEWPFYIGFTV